MSFAIKISEFMNSMLIIDTKAKINNGSYVVAKNRETSTVNIFEINTDKDNSLTLRKIGGNKIVVATISSYDVIGVAVQEVRGLK